MSGTRSGSMKSSISSSNDSTTTRSIRQPTSSDKQRKQTSLLSFFKTPVLKTPITKITTESESTLVPLLNQLWQQTTHPIDQQHNMSVDDTDSELEATSTTIVPTTATTTIRNLSTSTRNDTKMSSAIITTTSDDCLGAGAGAGSSCPTHQVTPEPIINDVNKSNSGPTMLKNKEDPSLLPAVSFVVAHPNSPLRQGIEEEQVPSPVSSTPSSSPAPSPSHGVEKDRGLSDYELLRLRNIERNQARLIALGLWKPSSSSPSSSRQKLRRTTSQMTNTTTKKLKRIIPSVPTRPTRRSTRIRQNNDDDSLKNNLRDDFHPEDDPYRTFTDHGSHQMMDDRMRRSTAMGDDNEKISSSGLLPLIPDTYDISPLMRSSAYAITSGNGPKTAGSYGSSSPSSSNYYYPLSSTSALLPLSKRLHPSMGAIYSLHFHKEWLVGAGKAGMIAIWNHRTESESEQQEGNRSDENNDNNEGWDSTINKTTKSSSTTKTTTSSSMTTSVVEPVLVWKAHSGRWIAEARWIANGRRLVTAGNDGSVCIWDVTKVSSQSRSPPCLCQVGGSGSGRTQSSSLHSSGIFALDVLESKDTSMSSNEILIATGSKDKTVQLSTLGGAGVGRGPPTQHEAPLDNKNNNHWGSWKSDHHSAKVGDVRFQGLASSSLLASVGDDGLVVIHDYRTHRIVAESSSAHRRPHSIQWHPKDSHILLTAGHDDKIKLWDIRRFGDSPNSCSTGATPLAICHGHVPIHEMKYSKIHRPIFYQDDYILTGGQSSYAISLFHTTTTTTSQQDLLLSTGNYRHAGDERRNGDTSSVVVDWKSQGRLPEECGDVGCIAVDRSSTRIAMSTEGGEILLMEPTELSTKDIP